MSALLFASSLLLSNTIVLFSPVGYRTGNFPTQNRAHFVENVQYPVFVGRGSFVKDVNRSVYKFVEKYVSDFEKGARDFQRDIPGRPTADWELDIKFTVSISTEGLISLIVHSYDYSGGAHPNSFDDCLNYQNRVGRAYKLQFSDLLRKGNSTSDFVGEFILPEVNRQKIARQVETVDSIESKLMDHFVLTPAGIAFLFNKYDVGPYVEGEYMVKLPWTEVGDWLELRS